LDAGNFSPSQYVNFDYSSSPPDSEGEEEKRGHPRFGVGTPPDISDSEEELDVASLAKSKKLSPRSRVDEEESSDPMVEGGKPRGSSGGEEADPTVVAQSKELLPRSSGDEDDPSELDLTSGQQTEAVELKNTSSDRMAVDESQPAAGSTAPIAEDMSMEDDDSNKLSDSPTAPIADDETMEDDGSQKSSDGPTAPVAEDETMEDDGSHKSSDGPTAPVAEDETMEDDGSHKSSDGPTAPVAEEETMDDDGSKKPSHEDFDSDDEDSPMNDDNANPSVRLDAPFELRRSSRLNPVKNYATPRLIVTPKSKSKRKPASSKVDAPPRLPRVSVQVIPSRKGCLNVI
jgi:hypothetical protein